MSSLQSIDAHSFSEAKLPWEPPMMIVERNLLARADEGPTDNSDETWALQRLLGPMNISGKNC